MTKNRCIKCRKEFRTFPSEIKRGRGKFCSKRCYFSILSGRKLSEEHRRRIGNAHRGRPKGDAQVKKMSESMLGKRISLKVRNKMRKTHLRIGTKPPRNPRSGSDHPFWKGGRSIRPTGYVFVLAKDDPAADINGYVAEHRLVMSRYLGRSLLKTEYVHHKNGNRQDNRLENLELWSRMQPSGQRVEDKLKWAYEIIKLYGKSDAGIGFEPTKF